MFLYFRSGGDETRPSCTVKELSTLSVSFLDIKSYSAGRGTPQTLSFSNLIFLSNHPNNIFFLDEAAATEDATLFTTMFRQMSHHLQARVYYHHHRLIDIWTSAWSNVPHLTSPSSLSTFSPFPKRALTLYGLSNVKRHLPDMLQAELHRALRQILFIQLCTIFEAVWP